MRFGAMIHAPSLHPMAGIHITDIEAAINHWRAKAPPPDGVSVAPVWRALAETYALMVFHRQSNVDETRLPPAALAAWLDWYATTPDTPCIAICMQRTAPSPDGATMSAPSDVAP